jgi:hypothetical protein
MSKVLIIDKCSEVTCPHFYTSVAGKKWWCNMNGLSLKDKFYDKFNFKGDFPSHCPLEDIEVKHKVDKVIYPLDGGGWVRGWK